MSVFFSFGILKAALNTRFLNKNFLILREIKFFPGLFVLSLLLPTLAAMLEGFGISFLLGFLQNLISPLDDPFQTGISWFDQSILGISEPALNRLARISGLVLLTIWGRTILNYWAEVSQRKAEMSLLNRLYKRIFEQLQSLDLRFFSKSRAGDIINTLTAEVGQLQNAIGSFNTLFSKICTSVVYVVILFLISWQLTLLSIMLFGLISVGLTSLNGRIREASFPVSRARSELTTRASEFISGIRTVLAFSTQDFERERFYQCSNNFSETSIEIYRRNAIVRPLSEALGSTVLIGVVIVGMAILIPEGLLEISSLFTFLFVLLKMIPAIQLINGSFSSLNLLRGSIDNIQSLLRTDDKDYLKDGKLSFGGFQKAIEFRSVDFGYELPELNLSSVTMVIQKGEHVALIGASGSGKSTLADLIVRFYDPSSGDIMVDGTNLKEYSMSSVRKHIAVVSQETFIFNATIRENIAYGSFDKSDEEIFQAARFANAEGFIREMPQGFDTILGDRGVRLSGGQRQRIAIARALLRDPEILILDEATSALDSVSERLIQESIDNLARGRTVLTIAHRLSTIEKADKVIVMDKGRIVEQGLYKDLLSQRGKFWNYHQIQHNSELS